MKYNYSLAVDSVFDCSKNSLQDTSFSITFRTLNADTLSAIRGLLTDEDTTATGTIFMFARQVSPGNINYDIQLQEPGDYAFENMLPGIYLINGFRDTDGNGQYSFGKSVPFVPAERFFNYPDSINIRSRWPTIGNDILLLKWK
jgi:hypothetical protein